jgi:hypothetical protein
VVGSNFAQPTTCAITIMMFCYGISVIDIYQLLMLYVIIIPLNSVHMHTISVNLIGIIIWKGIGMWHCPARGWGCYSCVEMIRWIIEHTIMDTKTIIYDEGRCITSFLPINLEANYKFPRVELYMTNE